ncbi:MAG TPA: GAF domain-containing sensor histidine kinase [Chloroflexota bacterium]|nr:GAF domain-containing sensor histidine kinase [Chloroflexota bacterium]
MPRYTPPRLMDHVQRVIVHDKPPIYDPAIWREPASVLALAATLFSLVAQLVTALGIGAFQDHLAYLGVGLLWLAIGVLVFLQRRVGHAGAAFLLSAAAGSLFLSLAPWYRSGPAAAWLFVVGLLLLPPFLLDFTRSFTEQRRWNRSELLIYAIPLLLVVPTASSLAVDRPGLAWHLTLAVVSLYLVAAIVQAGYDLLQASSAEQASQSRALLAGLVAGTGPAIFLFSGPLLLRGTVVVSMAWLPILILLFLAAMSYAVLLFEFSEADLLVRRSVVYGALTVVIVCAYAAFGVGLAAAGTAVTSPLGGLGFIAVTVLIGAAFGPITYYARRLVDWILYGRRSDRWRLLQDLSARLSALMSPQQLGNVLTREIAEALHLRGAFLLRRVEDCYVVQQGIQRDGRRTSLASLLGTSVPADLMLAALGSPPQPVLIIHRKPFAARHIGRLPDRFQILDDVQATLSIPLLTHEGADAILCLQAKVAHDAFDADDLELLAPLIRQTSVALDNAILYERLAEKVDELRDAYRRIAREQEAERARLAHELHDGTAQELAGLITLATVAERQMGDGPARLTLDRLRRQAEDAYQGVRRASHALRPPMLDDFGLIPTLVRYLEGFSEQTGIAVDTAFGEVTAVHSEVELALFRVVQECMENIRKHSGASSARVTMYAEGEVLALTVEDSGHGMSESVDRGLGMAGMRERVEAVGGEMVISGGASGVRVAVSVPLEPTWTASASS